jgi:hypothetical protein
MMACTAGLVDVVVDIPEKKALPTKSRVYPKYLQALGSVKIEIVFELNKH